jgi:pilus assembly protein CpaF
VTAPVPAVTASAHARLASRVHARLLADVDAHTAVDDARVRALAQLEAPLLDGPRLDEVVATVLAAACGLGPLDALLADPAVTDVMVNGPDQVWVERAGTLTRVPVVLDGPAIEHLIEKVVGPLGLRADRSAPIVDARLPDGSRVNAVMAPAAVDGPCLTIRRFGTRPVPLDAFCRGDVRELLEQAVRERRNIVVSGGTGAGKTTLLNALAGHIPPGERIVSVEDTAELRLPHDNVVRLEARPPNADGAGEVTVRALVRTALRMRPDRIVVGEVRGPEALDMLQAMNTGHEGSLSTCHANSPDDALRRLETMVLMGEVALPLEAVREQVASAVDLVVQVARRNGTRGIVEVAEVAAQRDTGEPLTTRTVWGDRGAPGRLQRRPRAAA